MAAIAFVAGFATVFVALGASASFIGSFVTDHLDVLAKIAGVIVIVFGLHFMGVFRIPFLYRDITMQGPTKAVGLLGPDPMLWDWRLRMAGRLVSGRF